MLGSAAGAAGVARVAVVSPDLRGLDRDALRHLAGHGVRVAGLVATGDDEGERRLRQLGVATILRPGEETTEVATALVALAGASTSGVLHEHATGTGTITVGGIVKVQVQPNGSSEWYDWRTVPFGTTASTTETACVEIPDGAGAVRLSWTVPSGSTGHTLDGEVSYISAY